MTGNVLKIVNLGPHTDSHQLITWLVYAIDQLMREYFSIRPISYNRLMEKFTSQFNALLLKSLDEKKNSKFISNLDVYLRNGRYVEYLRVVEETAKRILRKKVQ